MAPALLSLVPPLRDRGAAGDRGQLEGALPAAWVGATQELGYWEHTGTSAGS